MSDPINSTPVSSCIYCPPLEEKPGVICHSKTKNYDDSVTINYPRVYFQGDYRILHTDGSTRIGICKLFGYGEAVSYDKGVWPYSQSFPYEIQLHGDGSFMGFQYYVRNQANWYTQSVTCKTKE